MKEKFYKVVGWLFFIVLVGGMFLLTLNNIGNPRGETARERWDDLVSGDKASRESVNTMAEQAAESLMKE